MRNRLLLMHHRVGLTDEAQLSAAVDTPPRTPARRQPAGARPAPAPPAPSPAVRWRAWRRRWRLDRELAAGAGELSVSADLAWRAAQLRTPQQRRRLAADLRRAVNEGSSAEPPRRPATAPLQCAAIRDCRAGLLGLADRLEAPDPVDPCGVARLRRLLTDGTGPLYNPHPEHSLRDTLWQIADGLIESAPAVTR